MEVSSSAVSIDLFSEAFQLIRSPWYLKRSTYSILWLPILKYCGKSCLSLLWFLKRNSRSDLVLVSFKILGFVIRLLNFWPAERCYPRRLGDTFQTISPILIPLFSFRLWFHSPLSFSLGQLKSRNALQLPISLVLIHLLVLLQFWFWTIQPWIILLNRCLRVSLWWDSLNCF